MRILGVDPGLRRTGFGVIDVQGAKLSYVASGTIVVPTDVTLPLRLKVILDNLRQIVEDTKPDVAALEIVFMNTNPATTLLLGQARGAALCASVVGAGRAAKEQVQMMVQRLLRLDGIPAPDSADALACAICHAHIAPLTEKLSQMNYQARTSRGRTRVRAGRLLG
jgi:crossover junction endodeoxyribonuclease RuvC